jgi:mannosyltransferase OCH1-like enzyme
MFEKIIHQIWLQGKDKIPSSYHSCLKSVVKYTYNFNYILWDETDILVLLKQFPLYIEVYNKFTYMHQKIDFARYVILYVYGGIYIDMDVELIKPLESLIIEYNDNDIILSKIYNSNLFESKVNCDGTMCINNGIIIAGKNCDFLFGLINNIVTNYTCKFYEFKILCINNTTGPKAITRMYNQYTGSSRIKILEPEYLEPCLAGENCNITENTYAIHKHTLTWFDDRQKFVLKYYLRNKMICNLIVFLFLLSILFFLIKICYRN